MMLHCHAYKASGSETTLSELENVNVVDTHRMTNTCIKETVYA